VGSKDEYLEYLRRVPLFSACGNKELRRIASLTFDTTAEPGTEIVREGEPGHEFFLITEGTAIASLRGETLTTFGSGDFFGEMALVDQGPRSATVTAKSKVSLLVLGEREFSALIDDVPAVGKKILRGVANRLRSYQTASA
jgi:CRP/FNR family transcriptional regulator, cyclic AMP receptor protein